MKAAAWTGELSTAPEDKTGKKHKTETNTVLKGVGWGLLYIALPVLVILLWEYITHSGDVKVYNLPAPEVIVNDAVTRVRDGNLMKHISISFIRVLEGFAIAALAALAVGIFIGLNKYFERFMELVLQILKPIPPIAWIPLAILWFGIGETSKLYIIFYGAFFPILLNTVDGIHNIDKKYLELGRVYEVDKIRLVTKVILPGALPSILTGIRVGLGNAWVCVVAAEMIAATAGVGYMLTNGRSLSRADDVILAMLLIGIVGKIMDDVIKVISKKIMRWNAR